MNTLETLKRLAGRGPTGNRWFKVNLHVHGQGNDPAEIVKCVRAAEIDLILITDHQTFQYYNGISAAADTPGRPLTVLPGMEITTQEGVHILAAFPETQSDRDRTRFEGWLEIPGTGDTTRASKCSLEHIAKAVEDIGGIIAVPHPKSPKTGMLDSSRKLSTKVDWLESGHIRLFQCDEDTVQYIHRDAKGHFVNRYVLASARPQHIETSSYCLAPFNKSDAHTAEEVGNGCSWFRMSETTAEGLKQVACEPHTRIQRYAPEERATDCLLALSLTGGYFTGESFFFSDALNCIIGQNYAGKSSVLDFVRFALGQERHIQDEDDRQRFLGRLNGILQQDGMVELCLRKAGEFFVARRTFSPVATGTGPRYRIESCDTSPIFYRFDSVTHQLDPIDELEFPFELYEQGRINRLRSDLARQLEMLDEFARVSTIKEKRHDVLSQLSKSAERLAPLYEERERLSSQVAGLSELEKELTEKEKHLPGEEEKKWSVAQQSVDDLETVVTSLREGAERLNAIQKQDPVEEGGEFDALFGHEAPGEIDPEKVVHSALIEEWRTSVIAGLKRLEKLRKDIAAAVHSVVTESVAYRERWKELSSAHKTEIAATLAKAGVESPKELLERVAHLRSQINTIKTKSRPRLAKLATSIDREETDRQGLLTKLKTLNVQIISKRQEKAASLTRDLEEQIKVVLRPSADDTAYLAVLQDLTTQQNIRRDQLPFVTSKLTPLELAEALVRSGKVGEGDNARELRSVCSITEHTQKVLCHIADDINKLNRLQTIIVEDVPEILVRRRGEDSYANLRTELSPGEQSAALLMLALQTRSLPLILDQPEDELGYDYVVHLVVPSLLRAKFTRQVIVVTHNANIAVLGDADYVTKLENRPTPEGSRHCSPGVAGSFEDSAVTNALLDLEGGVQAFQFRLRRYSLPKTAKTDTINLLKPGIGKEDDGDA